MFTEYKLVVNINSTPLQLNSIGDIELVSPQNYVFTYDQILANSYNFDLNSSISLKQTNAGLLPYWITESSFEYKCMIDTRFKPNQVLSYSLYFQVIDYWGDTQNTNVFNLTVDPNKPPTENGKISNVVFYKGQESRKIPTVENMFLDPGDILNIYTTLWFEKDSQSMNVYYNKTGNYIQVLYPRTFVSVWTIAIVAKDSVSNIWVDIFQITIERKHILLKISLDFNL